MICKRNMARAGLKNHFRNLQAPLCGIFYSHSVAVARYAALIRIKSPTNWDSQLTISLFQTRVVFWLNNFIISRNIPPVIRTLPNSAIYPFIFISDSMR